MKKEASDTDKYSLSTLLSKVSTSKILQNRLNQNNEWSTTNKEGNIEDRDRDHNPFKKTETFPEKYNTSFSRMDPASNYTVQ